MRRETRYDGQRFTGERLADLELRGVVPTNAAGRTIGVVLMLVGISLIPTVTSLIVSVFVAQRSREATEEDRPHRHEVMRRLDALDDRLSKVDRPGA